MNNYIKKIKIRTVETFLNVPLKRNQVSIGFDVCMYATGIAIIRTTDKYLVLEKIHKITVPKLTKNATTKDELNNINLFCSQLEDFKRQVSKEYTLDINKIEDCFLSFSPKTFKALARYGILVYDRFKDISKDIDYLLPSPARNRINFKKAGKTSKGDKLKKEIIEYVNLALDTEIDDNDIADAIVLALAGLKEDIK